MDFVSLVSQGGLLWKAWVACHYERRLKRPDYLNADVKGICTYIMENMGRIPLRCLGHLMLGILRLLLKQASDLETKAEEVRSALHMSLSTGPGLPTVPMVSAASVTLRHAHGAVPMLDFGDAVPGLDMLMEPELPELEVEASLEEGRRHVAPLSLITLSSEPTDRDREAPIVELDDFGAVSAEDQATMSSMAAMGQTAMAAMNPEAAPRHRDTGQDPPVPPTPSAVQEAGVLQAAAPAAPETAQEQSDVELPPVDFLLGAASSPGFSPRRQLFMEDAECRLPGVEAAEAACGEAEQMAREALAAAEEVAEIARSLQEVPPLDFLLSSAPEVSHLELPAHLKLILEPEKASQEIPEAILNMEVEGDIDMEAEAPEALQPKAGAGELVPRQEDEMQIVPRRKRRRRSIWLDEKSTQIPQKVYEDTSKITRANPCEYGIFLPHQSYHIGLTTVFGDICPLLCDPLRRASDVGARLRRARAEETNIPSPPRDLPVPELAADASAVVEGEATGQAAAAPDPQDLEAEAAAPLLDTEEPPSFISPELQSQSPELSAVEAPGVEEPQSLAETDLAAHAPVAPPDEHPSEAEVLDAESAIVADAPIAPDAEVAVAELPPEVRPADEATVPPLDDLAPEQPEASPAKEATSMVHVDLPPPKRQAQENQGSVVPVKVAPPQVKQEETIEIDLNKVSAKQGRELRASLEEDNTLSFLDLCSSCTAEAAACRFVDLLSLHMSGVVSLEQEKPYGDIAIARGVDWEEWCDESKRGVKREARAKSGD